MFLASLRIEPEELLQISEAFDEAFYQLANREAITKFVSDPNTFNIYIQITTHSAINKIYSYSISTTIPLPNLETTW